MSLLLPGTWHLRTPCCTSCVWTGTPSNKIWYWCSSCSSSWPFDNEDQGPVTSNFMPPWKGPLNSCKLKKHPQNKLNEGFPGHRKWAKEKSWLEEKSFHIWLVPRKFCEKMRFPPLMAEIIIWIAKTTSNKESPRNMKVLRTTNKKNHLKGSKTYFPHYSCGQNKKVFLLPALEKVFLAQIMMIIFRHARVQILWLYFKSRKILGTFFSLKIKWNSLWRRGEKSGN